MNENELICIANFNSETEATLALGMLAEQNIAANLSGLEPSALGLDLGGDLLIELFVLESEREAAQQILASLENTDGDEESIPEWTCQCGEQVDEGFVVCWSCGAEYSDSNPPSV